MPRPVRPGSPRPLGASFDGTGTNFALFSASARQVTLCLWDDDGGEERIPLTEVDSFVWHAYLPGVRPPQRYGYRVDGVWDPASGRRSNPHKVLLDPYALAVDGGLDWGHGDEDAQRLFDYEWADGSMSLRDSAAQVPKAVVVDRSFDWGADEARPNRPLADTVVYEGHVRAMTMLHPAVPAADRGTYRGFGHPAVLEHLRRLGVTAVELMPVQQFLSGQGTTNFWGYDPIAFLAPHAAYSASGTAGQQVTEFKTMVRTLHEHGFEVLLDVVFNHTFEGGNDPDMPWRVGPTISLRGIDNRSYYLLDGADPRRYRNDTGTGNTLNVWDPDALRLIMDACRYWATDMHVDGFRFDLAAVLAQTDDTHSVSVFLDEIGQDPVLSGLKLVAEPWFGSNRPQLLGRFPPLWSQWNGDFHWAMRNFWKSTGSLGDMVDGLRGSPDLFDAADGERPTGSVNYAANHDGLTVRDTVSYTDEGQHAWNCRGPGQAEDDPEVTSLRARMQRNLLATAILAQGVPMVLYGDECGRTQGGNANAYDVDDPTTWMPWGTDQDADLLTFTRALLRLRADHPVFRRPRFFQQGTDGIDCFRPDGRPVGGDDLHASGPVALTVHIDGSVSLGVDASGRPVRDDASFLLLLNAHWDPMHFTVPDLPGQGAWDVVLATESATGPAADLGMDQTVVRPARSLMVLGRLT